MNSSWFKHDTHAINDPKVIHLISKGGIEYYGLFWICLETMFLNKGYISQSDIGVIAYRVRLDEKYIQDFFTDCVRCDLFVLDELGYCSFRMLQQLDYIDERSQKARENANKRWNSSRKAKVILRHKDSNATVMRPHTNRNADKIREDKIREDKIRENAPATIKDFVNLVYESHEDFKTVPIVTIENIIKTWIVSHKDLIKPAIDDMSTSYSGVDMKTPAGHLKNYLQKHLDIREKKKVDAGEDTRHSTLT